MSNFDVKKATNDCVQWIKDFFEKNGKDCMAVVGISGGVDSSVVTALCVKALGKDRVFGIKMPCGEQPDIEYANMLIKYLEIKSYTMNIWDAVIGIDNQFPTDIEVSKQTTINLPPRIRMAALYAISQSLNGRVVNTCNMSESYVGFDTRYGDSAGDLSPLANLTKTEVIALAKELGLPDELVHKTPQDGLTGLTDEQSFGFSYAELDAYIRDGIEPSEEVKAKIDSMHEKNLFKLQPMPSFVYQA